MEISLYHTSSLLKCCGLVFAPENERFEMELVSSFVDSFCSLLTFFSWIARTLLCCLCVKLLWCIRSWLGVKAENTGYHCVYEQLGGRHETRRHNSAFVTTARDRVKRWWRQILRWSWADGRECNKLTLQYYVPPIVSRWLTLSLSDWRCTQLTCHPSLSCLPWWKSLLSIPWLFLLQCWMLL